MDLEHDIERFLLEKGDWVPVIDICQHFGLLERRLRCLNGKPGLCSSFAISSDNGLKHITLATTKEWLAFKHRLRSHGIEELRRVRGLDQRRALVTKTFRKTEFEKDTGQGLLAMGVSV